MHAGPRDAGLFHTAILFDSQAALAAAIYSVATKAPGTFTGSADHLVSQAFYFTDPEGNGVELYWDRDRTEWSWTHGRVEMATLYLDPNEFIGAHLTETGMEQPNFGGPSSATFISRWETPRPPGSSTSTGSDSRPPRNSATPRSSSAPAATTTTWR